MSFIVDAFTAVVDTIFGGGPSQQQPAPAPAVAPVTPMPVADDAAVAAAKKKSIASIVARQGRASTILTAGNNKDTTGTPAGSALG